MTKRTMAQFAEEWSDLRAEEDTAYKNYQDAQRNHEILKAKRETVQKELHSSVGSNIPTKLFKTDAGIVLVQIKNGQSYVTLEILQ